VRAVLIHAKREMRRWTNSMVCCRGHFYGHLMFPALISSVLVVT